MFRNYCKYILLALMVLTSFNSFGRHHKDESAAYRYDTIPAVYDSVYCEGKLKTEYYIAVDTLYVPLLSKCYKVNSWATSATHLRAHDTEVSIDIPTDSILAKSNNCMKKGAASVKFHSFCYWIGVGDEALTSYREQNKASQGLISVVSSLLFEDYGPLITGAVALLTDSNNGNSVRYSFAQNDKVLDDGNVVSASARLTAITPGQPVVMTLKNDNYLTSIDVNVRVLVKQIQYSCKTRQSRSAGYYKKRLVSPMRIEKVEIK